MLIYHHAHSEFLIETAQGFRILTDPFDEHVGYPMHEVRCDAVTVSHGHGDHSYVQKAPEAQVIFGQTERVTVEPLWTPSAFAVKTVEPTLKRSPRRIVPVPVAVRVTVSASV